eukprot:m.131652 g.131652  ORF g.131652 m.131652 type:complete len:711 (-) comp13923_c1_seq2:391-2523(-)
MAQDPLVDSDTAGVDGLNGSSSSPVSPVKRETREDQMQQARKQDEHQERTGEEQSTPPPSSPQVPKLKLAMQVQDDVGDASSPASDYASPTVSKEPTGISYTSTDGGTDSVGLSPRPSQGHLLLSKQSSSTSMISTASTGSPTQQKRKKKRRAPTIKGPPAAANTKPVDLFRVLFYLNGDIKFAGRQILIDPRLTPTLDRLLDRATELLKPVWGAILRVYDATTFHRIESLEQLHSVRSVVAVGRPRLQRLNYSGIQTFQERELSYVKPDLSKNLKKPVVQSRFSDTKAAVNFRGIINGDDSGTVHHAVVPPRFQNSWQQVLESITMRLRDKLLNSAIHWLYDMDGNEVKALSEVQQDKIYVFVEKLPFKPPPFEVVEGQLERKVQAKPKLKVLPRISPTKHKGGDEGVIRAAFGRTGAGMFSPHYQHQRAKEALEKQKEKRRQQRQANAPRPQVQVKGAILDEDDALAALEAVVDEVHQSGMTMDEIDSALVYMHRMMRDKLFQHRQQAPTITTAFDDRIDEVLQFVMQPPPDPETAAKVVSKKFTMMVEAARSGRLAHWESLPASFVALVVLLDQFPRTIYKGTKEMYESDDMTRAVIVRALFHSSIMEELHPIYRLFPCFALSHLEDAEMQKLCLSEWETVSESLAKDDPVQQYGERFQNNASIIEAFGRFPDRNDVLGRVSTQDELEYLAAIGYTPHEPEQDTGAA